MVAKAQHYIHNPQAFLENSAIKSANNQMLAQFIGNGVANLASMSIFLCKQSEDKTVAPTKDEPVKEDKPEVIESDDDIKKNITEYLKDTGIKPDEASMDAIIKKYKNIKSFAKENNQELTEDKLKERIILFAKGLEYRKATTAGTTFEIAGVKEAMEAESTEGYKTAMNNHAASVIELYDENGDGALDRDEFFGSQLQAANEILTEENSAGMEIAFRFFDIDNSGKLEQNEVAALQWMTSKRNDGADVQRTGNDITADEYQAVQKDIATFVDTVLSANLSETEKDNVKTLLNQGKTADALTIILAKADESQRKQIEEMIGMYTTGYENLTKLN